MAKLYKNLETLEELSAELERVVGKARDGQDIQLSRAETNQIAKRLQELKALRNVVFGDESVDATPEKIELASRKADRDLLHKVSSENPDTVLTLLFSKMQSVVRYRRECMELKDELRNVRDALSAIGVPFWLDVVRPTDRLQERNPTLASVERIRSVVQELAGIISENEWRWDTEHAFEAADLRMSIEIILEDDAAEHWTREEIIKKLQEIADAKYDPDVESRTLIEELTSPFRERVKTLATAMQKALEALRAEDGKAAREAQSFLLKALEIQ